MRTSYGRLPGVIPGTVTQCNRAFSPAPSRYISGSSTLPHPRSNALFKSASLLEGVHAKPPSRGFCGIKPAAQDLFHIPLDRIFLSAFGSHADTGEPAKRAGLRRYGTSTLRGKTAFTQFTVNWCITGGSAPCTPGLPQRACCAPFGAGFHFEAVIRKTGFQLEDHTFLPTRRSSK